ncbi:fatty acid synthase alpha subunit Lsd1, partial [Coemansia sp. RSA 1694]
MSAFLHRESQDKRASSAYSKGFDVFSWLTLPDTRPDTRYQLSMAIALPLLGLTQMMHIVVLFKTLGVSPGELVKHFKVAVGHSQGIAIAVVLSSLTDEESLYDIGKKILGIQMLAGVILQRKYPCPRMPVPADKLAHGVIDGGEPRPMVSVQGVSKSALEHLLAKFNSRQPTSDLHMFIGVTNSMDHFIVAGHINSAVGFVALLRGESAYPDEDQSRVPYPKRKPTITTQYMSITAPYHCPLLEAAAGEAYATAIEKQWVLHASDMQVAVRASDDGHDIRSETDLTRYLFSSICVLP